MATEEQYGEKKRPQLNIDDLGMEIELTLAKELGARADACLGEHEWPTTDRIENASDLQLILWARYLPIAGCADETRIFNRIRNQIIQRKLLNDTLMVSQKDYKKILEKKDAWFHKFREIPAFSAMDDNRLRQIVERSQMMTYPPGSVIIEVGSADDKVHYLYKGHAKVVSKGKDLYDIKRRGDILGDLSTTKRSQQSFSIQAVTEVICVVTSSKRSFELAHQNEKDIMIETMTGINKMLKDRLELTNQQLERARALIQKLSAENK